MADRKVTIDASKRPDAPQRKAPSLPQKSASSPVASSPRRLPQQSPKNQSVTNPTISTGPTKPHFASSHSVSSVASPSSRTPVQVSNTTSPLISMQPLPSPAQKVEALPLVVESIDLDIDDTVSSSFGTSNGKFRKPYQDNPALKEMRLRGDSSSDYVPTNVLLDANANTIIAMNNDSSKPLSDPNFFVSDAKINSSEEKKDSERSSTGIPAQRTSVSQPPAPNTSVNRPSIALQQPKVIPPPPPALNEATSLHYEQEKSKRELLEKELQTEKKLREEREKAIITATQEVQELRKKLRERDLEIERLSEQVMRFRRLCQKEKQSRNYLAIKLDALQLRIDDMTNVAERDMNEDDNEEIDDDDDDDEKDEDAKKAQKEKKRQHKLQQQQKQQQKAREDEDEKRIKEMEKKKYSELDSEFDKLEQERKGLKKDRKKIEKGGGKSTIDNIEATLDREDNKQNLMRSSIDRPQRQIMMGFLTNDDLKVEEITQVHVHDEFKVEEISEPPSKKKTKNVPPPKSVPVSAPIQTSLPKSSGSTLSNDSDDDDSNINNNSKTNNNNNSNVATAVDKNSTTRSTGYVTPLPTIKQPSVSSKPTPFQQISEGFESKKTTLNNNNINNNNATKGRIMENKREQEDKDDDENDGEDEKGDEYFGPRQRISLSAFSPLSETEMEGIKLKEEQDNAREEKERFAFEQKEIETQKKNATVKQVNSNNAVGLNKDTFAIPSASSSSFSSSPPVTSTFPPTVTTYARSSSPPSSSPPSSSPPSSSPSSSPVLVSSSLSLLPSSLPSGSASVSGVKVVNYSQQSATVKNFHPPQLIAKSTDITSNVTIKNYKNTSMPNFSKLPTNNTSSSSSPSLPNPVAAASSPPQSSSSVEHAAVLPPDVNQSSKVPEPLPLLVHDEPLPLQSSAESDADIEKLQQSLLQLQLERELLEQQRLSTEQTKEEEEQTRRQRAQQQQQLQIDEQIQQSYNTMKRATSTSSSIASLPVQSDINNATPDPLVTSASLASEVNYTQDTKTISSQLMEGTRRPTVEFKNNNNNNNNSINNTNTTKIVSHAVPPMSSSALERQSTDSRDQMPSYHTMLGAPGRKESELEVIMVDNGNPSSNNAAFDPLTTKNNTSNITVNSNTINNNNKKPSNNGNEDSGSDVENNDADDISEEEKEEKPSREKRKEKGQKGKEKGESGEDGDSDTKAKARQILEIWREELKLEDAQLDYYAKDLEDIFELGDQARIEKEVASLRREIENSEYYLVKLIGGGGFGSVYRGLKRSTGTICAIKVIDLEESQDDIMTITREINAMQGKTCPQLINYYGSCVYGTKLWIAMEYVDGGSVLDKIKELTTLKERHIAIIVREVLLGLYYLFTEGGKIHRDIKAANILLSLSGEVKLADFGASRQLTDTMEKCNTFVGSPYWMAPEVMQQSQYDGKADIWSLGVTCLEMAYGKPPYSNVPPLKVMSLIVKNEAPELEGSGFSRSFKNFVKCCLIKDPTQRFSLTQLLKHQFVKSAKKNRVLRELWPNAKRN